MNPFIHATIAMLAVINPVVCATMLKQFTQGESKQSSIISGVKAMLTVLVIILIAILAGKYILNVFGISMDAFKVVGGVILSAIGMQLLIGKQNTTSGDGNNNLSPLIFFAASPGTITMAITLSIIHGTDGIPVEAITGTLIAVLITIAVMLLFQFFSKEGKSGGQGMFSKYMGLIVLAMGMQFILEGIKLFFSI